MRMRRRRSTCSETTAGYKRVQRTNRSHWVAAGGSCAFALAFQVIGTREVLAWPRIAAISDLTRGRKLLIRGRPFHLEQGVEPIQGRLDSVSQIALGRLPARRRGARGQEREHV